MSDRKRKPNYPRIVRNALALAGIVLLIGGAAGYGWRPGCIVAGLLMFSVGVVGMWNAARAGGRQRH